MELTVLGTSPACPVGGGACSGYLVTEGDTSVLLDCGTGALSNLRKHMDYRTVTAIVISHIHADHCLDLIPYRYGLKYGPEGPPGRRLLLYLPPDGQGKLLQMVEPFDGAREFFSEVFEVHEYDPGSSLAIGPLELVFTPTRHYVPANAISARAEEKKFAFSADTGYVGEVASLASGADLFLCEATLPEDAGPREMIGHLRGSDAGRMAAQAGVKRLMLTHTWSKNLGEAAAHAAGAAFPGPVELAQEHARYDI